jgi:arabinose-5-phosphate isomerase
MRKESVAWMHMDGDLPTEADENRYGMVMVTGPDRIDSFFIDRKIAIKHPKTWPYWHRAYTTNILELIEAEANAIKNIPIEEKDYEKAIDLINKRTWRGKLVTTGIGKAGQVAHNLATTFCSTGTPAVFLHPTEAMHGDLGILTGHDVLLMISNSGETQELIDLMKLIKEFQPTVPMILITSKNSAPLIGYATIVLNTGNPPEVCPLGLTPTTSTTVMTVIGDILVTMMMESICFRAKDYYARHHGGYLGKKAKSDWDKYINWNPRNDANAEEVIDGTDTK